MCSLLLEELFKQENRWNTLSQKLFYEQRNKPGRLLARSTQQRTLASRVHHIVDTAGVTDSKKWDIAYQFQCFYNNLYNLQFCALDSASTTRHADLIQDFL